MQSARDDSLSAASADNRRCSGGVATPPGPVSLAHAFDVWGCVVSWCSAVCFPPWFREQLARRSFANPDLHRDVRARVNETTIDTVPRDFDTVRKPSRVRTSERETKAGSDRKKEKESAREKERAGQSEWSAARDRSRCVPRVKGAFSPRGLSRTSRSPLCHRSRVPIDRFDWRGARGNQVDDASAQRCCRKHLTSSRLH